MNSISNMESVDGQDTSDENISKSTIDQVTRDESRLIVSPTDVRRNYTTMLSNVLNSSDADLIHSFWTHFGTPQIRLKKTHRMDQVMELPKVISYHGLAGIVAYWSAMMQLLPDHTVHFDDAKIHTRIDSPNSVITASYTSKCTIIYDILPPDLASHYLKTNRRRVANINHEFAESYENNGEQPEKKGKKSTKGFPPSAPLQHFISKSGALPKLLETPISVIVDGRATLYLNGMKQIIGFDISAKLKPAPSEI